MLPSLSPNHQTGQCLSSPFIRGWLSTCEAYSHEQIKAHPSKSSWSALETDQAHWWHVSLCEASVRSANKGLWEDCFTTTPLGIKKNKSLRLAEGIKLTSCPNKMSESRDFPIRSYWVLAASKMSLAKLREYEARNGKTFKVTSRLELILFKKIPFKCVQCRALKYPLLWG